MKFGLRRKFILAFSILVLISVSNFALLWFAQQNAAEQQEWINHTQKVIHESESFLGNLKNAETGQRGFLLTHRLEYLEPYNIGLAKAQENFSSLKFYTQDNIQQQKLLNNLKIDVDNKVKELGETIELARRNMTIEAMTIVNSDIGKQYMDSIRQKIQKFKDEEYRLLNERQEQFEQSKQLIMILSISETLLLIVFIAIVAYSIQRGIISPLINLNRNTLRMIDGKNIDFPLINTNDEIGELTSSFQKMNSTVNSTMAELSIAKNEAELKEQRLNEIIWSANVGTWQWNLKTDEITINERWAEMMGYLTIELMPTDFRMWKSHTHADDLKEMLEKIDKLISGNVDYFHNETRRRHKNGSWVWFLDRGKVSERDSDGKPIRVSGTSSDISKRKQADQLKSEFISTVSHELRTPLTSIKGSLGLLKSGVLGKFHDRSMSMLEVAYNNSERLVLLINDILDVEKMAIGKMDFDMKPIEVNHMINEAIESNKGYGEQHDISFQYSYTGDPIYIEGDKNRLIQVFSNLMSNAVKFSQQGEKVYLSTSLDDDLVHITIKDHGAGIPKEFHARLFEKFTQADSSTTRKVGGSGLGLNIAKTIVEEHNGTITFESEMGKGTIFTITLPKLSASSEKSLNIN